jgi:WD40 repeat protein
VNNIGRAKELLEPYHPRSVGSGSTHISDNTTKSAKVNPGWEWRYLWQQCKSEASSSFCKVAGEICSVSVSSDGRWLAIGLRTTNIISVWDLSNHLEIARIAASGRKGPQLAFSPKRPLLAYSGFNNTGTNQQDAVLLWSPEMRQNVSMLPIGGGCCGLAFAADGVHLLACSYDETLIRWDIDHDKRVVIGKLKTNSGRVLGAAFAATEDLSIVAGSLINDIWVFNASTGEQVWRTNAALEVVTALTFSPDGKILASG